MLKITLSGLGYNAVAGNTGLSSFV